MEKWRIHKNGTFIGFVTGPESIVTAYLKAIEVTHPTDKFTYAPADFTRWIQFSLDS